MTHIPRLTRLLHVLENLPPDANFNLTHFAAFDYGEFSCEPERTPGAHVCGTNACAVGYGALDPELRAQGLTLYASPLREVVDIKDFNELAQDPAVDCFVLLFGEHKGVAAAKEFFELSYSQFEHLFMPSGYDPERGYTPHCHVTREQVIDRLREFVA